MYWYSWCWDHSRKGKWSGFFSFLTSQETVVKIKDMVLQGCWADLMADWPWKVKVWVIFCASLTEWSGPPLHVQLCVSIPSVSAQSSYTCMMNLPGKLSNGIRALPSIIISLDTLWPWFCCCCTHQNGGTGGHGRECGWGWARRLGR